MPLSERNPSIPVAGSSRSRRLSNWLGDNARHQVQIIDSRGYTPNGTNGGGAGDSNFTNCDTRVLCRNGPVAASNIRLVLGNFTITSGKEADFANAVTARAAVEFWTGSAGTFAIQGVTFNGVQSVVMDPKAGLVISDPIGVTIEPGTVFTVRTNAQVASGELFPAGGLNHGGARLSDGPQSGDGGNMIRNTSATVVYTVGAITGTTVQGFPHMAVIGEVAGYSPAVVIYGDSIGFGSGDSVSTNAVSGNSSGWISRGLWIGSVANDNRLIPHANMSVSGTNLGHIGTVDALAGIDNQRRWAMLNWATHAVFQSGRNDISSGSSLATLQTTAIAAWKRAKSRGVKVAACKLMPSTTSTDAWATAANQTVTANFGIGGIRDQYNTWLDTKLADGTIDYVIDPNPYVEDQANPSKWASSPAAMTTDGVHPNAAGHLAASAAALAWANAIMIEQ